MHSKVPAAKVTSCRSTPVLPTRRPPKPHRLQPHRPPSPRWAKPRKVDRRSSLTRNHESGYGIEKLTTTNPQSTEAICLFDFEQAHDLVGWIAFYLFRR